MPSHQHQTPQQDTEAATFLGFEMPDLGVTQAWADFQGGWSTANDAAAMAGLQGSVGNAALQEQLARTETCSDEDLEADAGASGPTRYTVQAGDTLGSITKALGHPVGEYELLYQANRHQLASPNAVEVGQVLELPEAWTGVAPDAACEQPAEVQEEEPGYAERAGEAMGGAYNSAEAAAGEAIDTVNQGAEDLWSWVFGEDEEEAPDLSECAGPDMELEVMFRAERLTAEQIAEARELIAQLPEAEQGPWYEELQAKVGYRNQRNNETPSEGPGGGSCNLTALAMCLEYLGIKNPKPEMQYEDYLDSIRRDKGLGGITSHAAWQKVAAEMGANLTFDGGGVKPQEWYETTLQSWLSGGNGVLVSIHGHVIRIQAMDEDGLIVDDPYGLSILKPRPGGKPYSWATGGLNGYEDSGVDGTDPSNKGEDMVWPWADVVKYNFQTFGVVR